MDQKQIKSIVEAALFSAQEPRSIVELKKMFHGESVDRAKVKEAIESLQEDLTDRGIELVEVASGFRIQVGRDFAPWVAKLTEQRAPRFSRAMMETLALIAYRQPITRAEIEHIRGVSVSSNIVRALLEREWVRVVGYRDVPGKPALLGTTKAFLDYFSLKSLEELPSLMELTDIDSLHLNADMFEQEEAPAEVEAEEVEAEVEKAADLVESEDQAAIIVDAANDEDDMKLEEEVAEEVLG